MDARLVPEKSSGVSRNIMLITQKYMFYIWHFDRRLTWFFCVIFVAEGQRENLYFWFFVQTVPLTDTANMFDVTTKWGGVTVELLCFCASCDALLCDEMRRGRCESSVCVLDQTFPSERPLSHLGESFSLKFTLVFVAVKRHLRWRRGFPWEEVERGS